MLETGLVVPYVSIWDVLRPGVLHDSDWCAARNLQPQLPTLAECVHEGNSNLIQPSSASVGYLPNEGAHNLIQWSSTRAHDFAHSGEVIQPSIAAEYLVHEGELKLIQIQTFAPPADYFARAERKLNRIQPILQWSISPDGEVVATTVVTEPSPLFDFGCNVVASTAQVLADYISESERKARESWKKFCRKNISSSAVSKDGHLSFLVPNYREVCVETAARDHVIHLEVITLAEEQEAPSTSAVGQILISGGKTWKRWINKLSSLLSKSLRKTLLGGFTASGLNFASVEPLLQY